MCVGFWSLAHPKYALILCANRDEALARPTLPASFHSFEALSTNPVSSSSSSSSASASNHDVHSSAEDKVERRGSVLSGRDVLAGGTWLGINKSTGRIAFTTNITETPGAYASSRGTLAASFLADPRRDSGLARATATLTSQDPDATAEAEAATTTAAAVAATAPTTTTTSYAGFNLLLLEPGTTTTSGTGNAASAELTYDARLLTNGGGGGRIRARTLSDAERACGGMSNGVDGEGGDAWPKVVQGRAALRSILDEIEEEDHKDHKDQDQDQEGTSGGPDHEIADADDAADSRLAERLIELLTAPSSNPPLRERAEFRNVIFIPPYVDVSSSGSTPGAPSFYGTRLAQVILIGRDGRVTYIERDVWTLDGAGMPVRASAADMRSFTFRLGSNP